MAKDRNSDREAVEEPTVDDYKGNPILRLPLGNGRDFGFGISKARAIVRYEKDIRDFVEDNDRT